MNGEEILEGRGMRIRRDDSSTEEVERAHVEGTERANGGPPHIHLLQEERFIVHTGALNVRRRRDRIRVGAGEEIRIPPKSYTPFMLRLRAPTRSSFAPRFASRSSSAISLRSPLIGAAIPASAMPPA
jgi:hypothetical protein